MSSAQRLLNLNVGLNTTGYVTQAWKHRRGQREDVWDGAFYRRLTELAHRGRFDAVFFSDQPALMTDPLARSHHTLDPLVLSATLAAQAPDIGFVVTISSSFNSPYNFARPTGSATRFTCATASNGTTGRILPRPTSPSRSSS
jgi:alkanesulfonate monooxygenase SsuD/methylene tetrahydromethanopterin reductase-like flavin-dependent oxidoreductase (luciferase family)